MKLDEFKVIPVSFAVHFFLFLCATKQIQNNLQRIECFLLSQHVKETEVGRRRRRGVDGMMGKEIGSENERRRGR